MDLATTEVSVIGLGYVGLPTAATLASRGLQVTGVDISDEAVTAINEGRIHITEPELDILVQATVQTGRLKAQKVASPADVFLLAVPTPFHDNREPDLSYLENAVAMIAPVLKSGDLIILESTSPVGTTRKISSWLERHRPDLVFPGQNKNPDINLAHCPERVLPGKVLRELVENDRIIGGLSEQCGEKAGSFYQLFVSGEQFVTTAETAELAKLSENSYRDVNIAFANELSLICDRFDVDVWELIRLTNRHPRVNILQPGPGVGGHCIAVDPWFIVAGAPEESRLIRTARQVNDDKPKFVLEKTLSAADKLKSPRIACFGLSYKPDIDDLRESPALAIVRELARKSSAPIKVVEPHIAKLPNTLSCFNHVELTSVQTALEASDIILLLVGHRQFDNLSETKLDGKIVIRAANNRK